MAPFPGVGAARQLSPPHSQGVTVNPWPSLLPHQAVPGQCLQECQCLNLRTVLFPKDLLSLLLLILSPLLLPCASFLTFCPCLLNDRLFVPGAGWFEPEGRRVGAVGCRRTLAMN